MSETPSEEDELSAIERLDAGQAPQSDDEARLRAPYEQLAARLRDTEEAVEPPPGWQERAMARWARARRRRWIGAAVASGSALAAAAAALLLRCSAMVGGPMITTQLARASDSIRSGDAVVGDIWKIASERGSILLYRDGRRIAQCPGDERCRRAGGGYALDWTLAEPGEYDIVSMQRDGGPWIPSDAAGARDLDLLEARDEGSKVKRSEPLRVTR